VDLGHVAPGRWAVEVVTSTPAKVRSELHRGEGVLSLRFSTDEAGPVEVRELVLRSLPAPRGPADAPP
jgi:hypothetical protein